MIDVKHAAPDLAAIQIEGMSRSAFMMRSALAVGAVYGTTMVSPFVRQALAQSGGGDIEILNFALTLEYLEADFYEKSMRLSLDSELLDIATEFGSNEAEHVEALAGTITDLGGTPVEKPTFMFPLKNQASFLKLAQTLEDTGVGAYNGAGPMIESKEILAAAGSIVQIEARHAAAIRLKNKAEPAPAAFDEALEMQAVLDAVKPFIKA
ncbi:MAG: ferritin-like domain-containing protein [Actinobacteria bacterium]|nr:ferritin-like domain-containing protein [Actinomycetota bacterium]